MLFVLCTTTALTAAADEPAPTPSAAPPELQGSPTTLERLLPERTRFVLKISPNRMRAATARLSEWFPADATLYHQNRHPEARVAAALLDNEFGASFFDEYSDERLPNLSAHTPDTPIFVAVSLPGTQPLLRRARFGRPILDPAVLGGAIHARLLIPSPTPGELVDAIETYCGNAPRLRHVRRFGDCRSLVGARSESGYLIVDAATSLSETPLQRREWLRRKFGHQPGHLDDQRSDRMPAGPRLGDSSIVGYAEGPPADGTSGGKESGFFARKTPAVRRLLNEHRAFEFYARLDDLWRFWAIQAAMGTGGRGGGAYVSRLHGFARSSLRASAALAPADPDGREIEDVHFTAGLGPDESVEVSVTTSLTELGAEYVPDEDRTPRVRIPSIDDSNIRLSWDAKSLQPIGGVELPTWFTEQLDVTDLFAGQGDTRRAYPPGRRAVRRSGDIDPLDKWVQGVSGQLIMLSQPTALFAINRSREEASSSLGEFLRQTQVYPLAGELSARFAVEDAPRSSPIKAFGMEALTPSPNPSMPEKKKLAREFDLDAEDGLHLQSGSARGLGRVRVTGSQDIEDVFSQTSTTSGANARQSSSLSGFALDLNLRSMFRRLVENPDEAGYGERTWLHLGRAGEFHARAGRRADEVVAVATLGPIDSPTNLDVTDPPDASDYHLRSAQHLSSLETCRRSWLRNLVHASARNWLRQEDGLARVAQLARQCDQASEQRPTWLDDTIRAWARLLSRETAATANFDVAADYARQACDTREGALCSDLTPLTILEQTLQLPVSDQLRRASDVMSRTYLDTHQPLPTIVSVTPRGLFIGATRIADVSSLQTSHIKPELRKTFRRRLDRATARRRAETAFLKYRRWPNAYGGAGETTVYLAVDRRAPTSAVVKLLELMPASHELAPAATFKGNVVIDGDETSTNREFSIRSKLRTTNSPHNRTAFVEVTPEGIDIRVPEGQLDPGEGCPETGPTICSDDATQMRLRFVSISGQQFRRDWHQGEDRAAHQRISQLREFGGYVAGDHTATTVALEEASSGLRIQRAVERLGSWLKQRNEQLRRNHEGYGDPPAAVSQIILIPHADVPWTLTLRLYTRLLRVSPSRGYNSRTPTLHLARPSLHWAPAEQTSKSGGKQ